MPRRVRQPRPPLRRKKEQRAVEALMSQHQPPPGAARCTHAEGRRKFRFESREAAEEWATRAREKDSRLPPMRAYECPDCHGWHLTKQIPRQQAEKDARA